MTKASMTDTTAANKKTLRALLEELNRGLADGERLKEMTALVAELAEQTKKELESRLPAITS